MPTQPTTRLMHINKCLCQHTVMVFVQYNCQQAPGLEMPFVFAVTYCILNRWFVDQQSVGPREATNLIAAIRY